ncbi:MAG: hypothetical protein KJ056_06210, partial [Acidimicrobiia bacterium]|nr:hypothetical protein [Acidimicrobiia bacterium]
IDAAVEDGKIPEERAARIEERLPERMQKLVEREGLGGARHRRATARRHVAEVAAKTIGISHDDLVAALRDGSSIADVAEKNGVDPSKVVDALVADATTRIDAAVEDGKIPEERAARIKERLPERMQKLVEREGPRGGRPAGPAEPDA